MKLTEKEFDTIIEALEKLPSERIDGKLFGHLMCSIFAQGDEAKAQEMKDSLAVKELEEEVQRKAIKKICGIIAGKLYMMKDEIVECEPPPITNIPTISNMNHAAKHHYV